MNALQLNYWLKQHWKLLLIIIVVAVILGETIFQIVYPGSRLMPGTKVDGVDLGGMKYADAAKKLDGLYGSLKLNIYFGKNDAAFQEPKMSDVGIGVDNAARLSTLNYPFYLRFIPSSLFWAPQLQKTGEISYTYDKTKIANYTIGEVGSDCSIAPQNASLKLVDSQMQLIPSVAGGTCDINQFQQALAQVQPSPDGKNQVRIGINETPAPVTDDIARALAAKLNARLAAAMPITVDTSTDQIPGRVVLSWLDFKAIVPEQSLDNNVAQAASLQYLVNKDRMQQYLNQGIAAQLIVKPGVSKVTTLDFNETARTNGANGRAVDIQGAALSVVNYIEGKAQTATGATTVVGPSTQYTRNYTPTSNGFSALLAQYAQDNPGTYGLAFAELSGPAHLRSASYQADAKLPGGGIHALYLAYTYQMEQAAGTIRPVDIISGNTKASDCLDDMLQKADDGCRKGFYDAFGYQKLTARGAELGLTNTQFAGEDTKTSANDVQRVMVGLYKNQVARDTGGSHILNDLRSIRENAGIPAGLSKSSAIHIASVANNVYNDSAIIYTTNYGAYALTVLSSDASADKVAGLASKIQTLKQVKIPADAR